MNNQEHLIIPIGAMINFGNYEDDDPFIVKEPLVAFPVGNLKDGGIPVKIPSLDPERTYFFHQPEKRASK